MQRFVRLALAVVVASLVGGCRQADGPMPMPQGDQVNEISDIARDLMNVVNRDPQAAEDLRGDLGKYGQTTATSAKATDLAAEVARVLPGSRLDDDSAQKLAHTLWVSVNAKQLSERQITNLQKELKDALTLVGVEEGRAQPVADTLGDVQRATTGNERRWYQVF